MEKWANALAAALRAATDAALTTKDVCELIAKEATSQADAADDRQTYAPPLPQGGVAAHFAKDCPETNLYAGSADATFNAEPPANDAAHFARSVGAAAPASTDDARRQLLDELIRIYLATPDANSVRYLHEIIGSGFQVEVRMGQDFGGEAFVGELCANVEAAAESAAAYAVECFRRRRLP